ncbi:MAG: ABC transporter substrate-binding protein, partial [Candidatus Hodarchaeota archaeon]
HDLVVGWPFGHGLFCQWQEGGTKVVLSSGGIIYPDDLTTGNLILPEWGINYVDPIIDSYIAPGAPLDISLDQIIKIGLLDDMEHFSGDHAWKGALLAAREINMAGGINYDGIDHYIGLVSEDTNEAEIGVDPAQGVAAAVKMIDEHNPHFVIGGFRQDALLAYIEPVMDNQIPFIGTGQANNIFCQNVLNNYDRYKYFFRVMPINSSSIFLELVTYISYLANHLTAIFGTEVNKIALIYEDLPWVYPMVDGLYNFLPSYGLEIVKEFAFPISATEEDFTNYWNEINDAGVQITIPLISQSDGILLSQKYAEVQPKCLVCGINVPGQLDTYYIDTNGGCQYEILMQLYRTEKTPLTIPFWDSFVEAYGHNPLYLGIGSYDAVRLLAHAVYETQSTEPESIVPYLEGIDTTNSFIGAGGNIAFTSSHDLFEGYPYGYSTFCQWQEGGTKVVLSSGNNIYPDSLTTGSLILPEWFTPPTIIYDTIPDEIKITYTRSPQIIGSIKAYDLSNIFYVGWEPFSNPDPGFSLITTYNEVEMGTMIFSFTEIVVMTTSLLEPGIHPLNFIIFDSQMNTYAKSFTVEVYRKADLKLSGEFDYLEKEKVKISIAAQVLDLEEKFLMIPTSGIDFTVHIRIVDYNGVTKVEDELVFDSNGYFHWDSIFTIDDLKQFFPKGIYIVQGWIEFSDSSYYEGGNDVIQFHIDPPNDTEPNFWLFLEIFSYVGLITVIITLTFLLLRERRRHIVSKNR